MRTQKIKRVVTSILVSCIIFLNLAPATYAAQPSEVATAGQTTEEEPDFSLDERQKNSIAMLNYLTVLTQDINDASNNRLYMEEVYNSLISNTYPNAVDQRTQSQLTSLLDTLEGYRMVDVKRERLEYIYEQNKAMAIKSAIPINGDRHHRGSRHHPRCRRYPGLSAPATAGARTAFRPIFLSYGAGSR